MIHDTCLFGIPQGLLSSEPQLEAVDAVSAGVGHTYASVSRVDIMTLELHNYNSNRSKTNTTTALHKTSTVGTAGAY